MMKYENRYGFCYTPDLDVDVLGCSLSGGADSAILTYLIAKDIIDSNSYTRILPFTRERPYPQPFPKNWNIWRSRLVIDKINELLGKNVFLYHFIDPQPKNQLEKQTPEQEKEHVRDLHGRLAENSVGTFKFVYGVTANPPEIEMIKHNFLTKWRVIDRDKIKDKPMPSRPFDCVDKRFVAELYKQTNTLETLFPVTYSCEGMHDVTDNYQNHCGKCWWCKERYWAFGRYV